MTCAALQQPKLLHQSCTPSHHCLSCCSSPYFSFIPMGIPSSEGPNCKIETDKTGPAQGVKVTIPGDPSAWPPKSMVQACPTCHARPPTSLHNHNHGIHILWYAEPSHICWECFQCFNHPAAVEVHLWDTACSYAEAMSTRLWPYGPHWY